MESHQFQQQPTGARWRWPSAPLDEIVPGFAGNKDLVGQRESDNAAALFATASLVVALTSGTDGNAVLMIHIDRSLSRFSFETGSNRRPLTLRCFSVTAGGRSALGWGFTGIGAAAGDQMVSGLGLEVGQENQICDDQRPLPTAVLGRHFQSLTGIADVLRDRIEPIGRAPVPSRTHPRRSRSPPRRRGDGDGSDPGDDELPEDQPVAAGPCPQNCESCEIAIRYRRWLPVAPAMQTVNRCIGWPQGHVAMGPPLHHLCHRCLMLQAVQRGEAAVDDDSGDDTNGPDEARGHRPQAPLTVRAMDRSEASGRMPAPSEVAPASTQDDAPYDDRSGTGALVRNQASDVELTTPVEGAGLAVPSTGHPDEPVADDCSELGSETGDLDEDVDMFECELEEDLIFIGSCSDFAPCTAGFYPVQTVTWEDLRAVRTRLGPIDQAGSGPEWSVAPTGVPPAAQPAVASPSENSEASDPDDGSSEGSTTSQDESSGSSEEQPRETALHAPAVAWLLQHDRVHVVAEYTASGEAIPYCRTGQDTPFRSEPRRTGHGAVSAIEAGHVCAKCVGRVPRATLCAITDA